MNLILIDDEKTWLNLLPLTYTRPVCEIRIGILTIKEKWDKHLKTKASYGCKDYLRLKFPTVFKKDTNKISIIDNKGEISNFDLKSKLLVAEDIAKKIEMFFNHKD